VPSFEGRVGWDEKGVHLRELQVAALSGSAC